MSPHRRILQFNPMNGPDLASRPPAPSLDRPRRDLSNLFIAGGCLVSAAFFLALSYYAVLSHRRRRRGVAAGGDADSISSAGDAPHHAWTVQTVGLDEATIASIAIRAYKAAEGGGGAADCSVCLGDFSDGELLRLIPKCEHAFHVACIDTWLRAHVSCPLCRAEIVATAPPGVDLSDDSEPRVQETGTDGGLGEGDGGDDGESEMDGRCEATLDVSAVSSESPLRLLDRRSLSVDLLPGESSHGEEKDSGFLEEEGTKNGGKLGSSSKEVDKSQSGSSGRGFFFSKSRRSRSMALPL